MMDKLNQIYDELLGNKKINYALAITPRDELSLLHFSVGLYIRNNCLWQNSENFKVLSEFYNTLNIDEISRFIIKEIYCLTHKN